MNALHIHKSSVINTSDRGVQKTHLGALQVGFGMSKLSLATLA